MLGIPGTPSIPGDPIEAGVNLITGGGGSGLASSLLPQTSSSSGPDYSDATRVASDNAKIEAEGQILTQEMAMRQAALDRELQNKANLELSLEKFDTSMQTSKLEFRQQMTAEENRHIETIAAHAAQFGQLTSTTYDSSPDLPPPASISDS